MTAPLLSPEEVAQLCGLSRRAVYRAIDRGELKASRLCSRLRVRHEDLDAWVDGQRVEPAAPEMPQRAAPARPPASQTDGGLRSVLAEYDREEDS